MTLKDIEQAFDKVFKSDSGRNCVWHSNHKLKSFYSSQIRELLEGLRLEKLKGHDFEGGDFDFAEDGYNQAASELDEKINKILDA